MSDQWVPCGSSCVTLFAPPAVGGTMDSSQCAWPNGPRIARAVENHLSGNLSGNLDLPGPDLSEEPPHG